MMTRKWIFDQYKSAPYENDMNENGYIHSQTNPEIKDRTTTKLMFNTKDINIET